MSQVVDEMSVMRRVHSRRRSAARASMKLGVALRGYQGKATVDGFSSLFVRFVIAFPALDSRCGRVPPSKSTGDAASLRLGGRSSG